MKPRIRTLVEYGAALVLLVAAWWYASGPMGMPRYLLPSPQATVETLWEMLWSGGLMPHFLFTVQTILLGLGIGAVAGVAGAHVLYRYRLPRLSTLLDGPLVVFQTAPKIALAPLVVVWFGLGLTAKLVLIFSLVFFPVLVGALAGFRNIDPRMHDLSKLLKLTAWQRFRQIDLVAAMPGIFVGLKIGAVQALVGAVLAEWIFGAQGLGYLMTFSLKTSVWPPWPFWPARPQPLPPTPSPCRSTAPSCPSTRRSMPASKTASSPIRTSRWNSSTPGPRTS